MRPLPRRVRTQQQLLQRAESNASAASGVNARRNGDARDVTSLSVNTPGGAQRPPSVLRGREPSDKIALLQSSWVNVLLNEQRTGVPPLHQALLDADFPMAEALLDAGASVKAEIRPPLAPGRATACTLFSLARPDAFASRFGERQAEYRNQCLTEIAALTAHAAPRRRLALSGSNALTLAVACRAPDGLIARLCALGSREYADILNQQDGCGRTPLSIASADGHLAHVVLLLALGADPDRETGAGRRPLQFAAESGHRDIFIALLESGASLHVGKESARPLDYCIRDGRIDLLRACQRVSASHRVAVIKSLLRRGMALLACSDAEFSSFVQSAAPLLDDRRLAKFAIAVARIPGSAGKLAVLCDNMATPFPAETRWSLRANAKLSGDPHVVAFVCSRYPQPPG